ncbi:Transcription factor [Capsicum baccatum]|uniref:Transcription factor n=1 Tax=Capsicum baccatum TaxID=33114 RepID=A0A2G2WTT7_CAPBA|nr:Transcription factor [Capsicum baccatum]
MASMLMKNPMTFSSDRSILARRKKKKRSSSSKNQNQNNIINHNNIINNNNNNRDSNITEWNSQSQQQVYSYKLLKALHQAQTSSSAPKGGRAVRKVADRVLAIAAKGRSRWSRAILTNRLKLKFIKRLSKRQKIAASPTIRLPKKPRASMLKPRMKYLPAFQKKARVLSHIVPGCREQPLPVVLEEATDYIAALEMQIRAMSALADLLSGASTSNAPHDQLG